MVRSRSSPHSHKHISNWSVKYAQPYGANPQVLACASINIKIKTFWDLVYAFQPVGNYFKKNICSWWLTTEFSGLTGFCNNDDVFMGWTGSCYKIRASPFTSNLPSHCLVPYSLMILQVYTPASDFTADFIIISQLPFSVSRTMCRGPVFMVTLSLSLDLKGGKTGLYVTLCYTAVCESFKIDPYSAYQ